MSEDESLEGETESSESEIKNPLGRYEGNRNALGERHGRGKALLPNGDMYVGEYCQGLRHGRGLYVFSKSGARYEGDWRWGMKHGRGIFHYPDGTRYEGEWRRDRKCGFGAYHYRNGDVYEGSWKHDLRHGLGTYTYAVHVGSCFYGTWIADRMQGVGQLVHQQHRFHGFWETNLPMGRGCYIFENGCMQHGYYTLMRDPDYREIQTNEVAVHEPETEIEEDKRESGEVAARKTENKDVIIRVPLKKGVIPVWRARCVTAYNPDMLPPEPMPFHEIASEESLSDVCEDEELGTGAEEYLKKDDYESLVGETEEDYEGLDE